MTADDNKTITNANVAGAIPPDQKPDELEKVATQSEAPENGGAAFVPNDRVYSTAHNQLGQVVFAQPEGDGYLYHITLLGDNGVADGTAIVAEGDLELRRDKAAKTRVDDAVIPVPQDQAMRADKMLEVLAKACEAKKVYGDRHDATAGKVQSLIRSWKKQRLPQHEAAAVAQAIDQLDLARRAFGELDGPGIENAITGAKTALQGITDQYAQSEVVESLTDTVTDDDAPSMAAIVKFLKSCRDKLDSGDPELIKTTLDMAVNQLGRIETTSPNASRTIGLMKGLAQRAARQVGKDATLFGNKRSQGVGHGKDRQALSNVLAQAAFLGDVAMRRQAVRSLDAIAAEYGLSIKAAYKLLSQHTNLLTHQEVAYQDNAEGEQQCGNCRWFTGGNSCHILSDAINEDGWCNRWENADDAQYV